jgi:hypothetical protein
VTPTQRQTTAENMRAAARLSGQQIASIRYFLLSVDDAEDSRRWDFGLWHAPTMGVEVHTGDGQTYSAIWSQYEAWGYGVDLFPVPMSAHLIEAAADTWAEATQHPLWSPLVGAPIEVGFRWNDFGTGLPPCPEAVTITTRSAAVWIIAGEAERQAGTPSFRLGVADLLVVFDEELVRATGLYDPPTGPD